VIPVAKPLLDERDVDAARRAILSGWVTQGPEVAGFEQEFGAAVGAPHACAVSSCTAALHLALRGVGVGAGDRVITVSQSFIATANAVRYCGATPVFVDIEPGTFNMDPRRIERAIGSGARAILCVHQFGMPCDLSAIVDLARRHGLPVVEDAACATGSEIRWDGRWEPIGRPHADVACFSFHPRKLLTTGDGGMLTTADPAIDRNFRLWRQHGMSVPDAVRHAAGTVIDEDYTTLGYNYRLTDIQAAIGREQIRKLPEILARRRALAARYRELLGDVTAITLPEEPAWARSNWQSYCLTLAPHLDRHAVMEALLARGISTRRGVICIHRQPAYPAGTWEEGPEGLAVSEQAHERGLVIPLFHQMTTDDQDAVAAALHEVCVASPDEGAGSSRPARGA
jgi:dTDP-4-amino-4,6-dideoxygalactose transaminase